MLRKMRDSNPRYPKKGIPDFESSAFGHSANLPSSLSDAKVRLFLHLTKYRRFFLIKLYFHLPNTLQCLQVSVCFDGCFGS